MPRDMRILFAIPHVFNPQGGGAYPSTRKDPTPRLLAMRSCLTAIHKNFGPLQHKLHILHRRSYPANQTHAHEIDIALCTTRGLHLIGREGLPPDTFRHVEFDVEPMMLEFEIQAFLRDHLGRYDFYCFLEDDLTIHDPWFFHKLAWFNQYTGPLNLLQPNRYEAGLGHNVHKLYVDGEINPSSSSPYQDINDQPELRGTAMGVPLVFRRTTNPHAGAYFLNHAQLEHWTRQPHFLDRDCSFVGPLESAATLGIMKTFRCYKPAPENACFLEIEHYGDEMLAGRRAGNRSGIHPKIG